MPIRKERILLVEDNDTMRDGVRDVLDLAGYDIEVAADGERALAVLDDVRPDLIITVESKLKRSRQLEDLSQAAMADLKSSIVRTLSHEFRTPLTFIQGYSELLEMSGPEIDSQSFQEFLRGIRRGSERLNRLVEDFLLLVRLQTGQADEALQASNTDVRILSLLRQVTDDV